MIRIVYGSSIDRAGRDEMFAYIRDFIDRQALVSVPGSFLVEIFPAMLHLPEWLAPWKKWVNHCFKQDSAVFNRSVDRVKDVMVGARE